MRRTWIVKTLGAVVAVLALGACASTELANYDFEGESLRVIVRVAPDARVRANYFVTIDPADMVGTIVSVGTSVAKATQVEEAQRKLDAVMDNLDLAQILESDVGEYYSDVMEMQISESRSRATYVLSMEITKYGIDSDGPGSSVEFVLSGDATLTDNETGKRIWHRGFHESEQFSPAVFGLPASAGNVISAAMLSEMTEDDIRSGIEQVTHDSAWSITGTFENDLDRARRSQ